MDEKNDAATEKDVFLYIQDHPGCMKNAIVMALRTNPWLITHKLANLRETCLITETGEGKLKKYTVVPEFADSEPVFPKKHLHQHNRRVAHSAQVVDAYKKMLAGEELDRIEAPDDVKSTIRIFEKYKSRSARQITDITGISITTAANLRDLNRRKLRECSKKSFARRPFIGWTIRQIACGTPFHVIRAEVTDKVITQAVTFIKMANAGARYF